MSRSFAFDLLAGLPRVALASSHCLNGDVTTPFGQEPGPDEVEAKWASLVGSDRESPPWIVLGRRETPSGIVWRILFCPSRGTLPGDAEFVLPMAAWVLQILRPQAGPPGWHVRVTEIDGEFWGGLWEGERCERVHGPYRAQGLLVQRCLHGVEDSTGSDKPVLNLPWRMPSQKDLRALAADHSCGDLLGLESSLDRAQTRERNASWARLAAVLVVFLLVTGGFGLFQVGAWRVRAFQENRLASVRTEVESAARLESFSRNLVDTLLARREALAPNSSADLVLRAVAAQVPSNVKLQVIALEPTSSGFRARLEARFQEWSQVQPFSEALRSGKGVGRVAVVSQTRQADAVMAVLEMEGAWP
ncbi:MAG: hypothetical protein IPK50_00575 [Fibrobacterota bacterium]|nr:hypothetical protein [Fibrobacterota bacterium]QQS05410.1 MAG: hypothetical protein IPK50_00575 [Fibrobacterota bacterium]